MESTLTGEQVGHLLAQAQSGDAAALAGLRAWLDGNPDLWRRLGDLAGHARDALIGLASGGDTLARESMARCLDELEAELAGASPTPLERLLARRVALTWAQAHVADLEAIQHGQKATPLAAQAVRRQESAQRRLAQAVRSLATARRLLPGAALRPALRVVGGEGT